MEQEVTEDEGRWLTVNHGDLSVDLWVQHQMSMEQVDDFLSRESVEKRKQLPLLASSMCFLWRGVTFHDKVQAHIDTHTETGPKSKHQSTLSTIQGSGSGQITRVSHYSKSEAEIWFQVLSKSAGKMPTCRQVSRQSGRGLGLVDLGQVKPIS